MNHNRQLKNEDAALLEIESYFPENQKMPLLNDMIVFGPKIPMQKEPVAEKQQIPTKIHVCNLFFGIVLVILGLLSVAFTILGIVKMGPMAKYYISLYIFSILVGVLLMIAGFGSIRMKLNSMYSKYFVIFIIAIESGCFLVFLLIAFNGFQQLMVYAPYSFYSKITMGIFTFSLVVLVSLMAHLVAVIRYIK